MAFRSLGTSCTVSSAWRATHVFGGRIYVVAGVVGGRWLFGVAFCGGSSLCRWHVCMGMLCAVALWTLGMRKLWWWYMVCLSPARGFLPRRRWGDRLRVRGSPMVRGLRLPVVVGRGLRLPVVVELGVCRVQMFRGYHEGMSRLFRAPM